MAVDHEQLVADASTAAAESVAREARASTESTSTEAPEPIGQGRALGDSAPAPFDVDAYYAQYESAPEDARQKLAERFLQAEPIRKQISAESSRAINRAQQQAQQAQAREAETRLDYILADENHPEHYTELEKHGTARADLATQRVGIRAAIERPEVRVAAKIELAEYLVGGLMASGQYPDVTPDEWSEALQQADLVQAFQFVNHKQREAHRSAWLKEFEPAIEARALDRFRGGLPNPDAGRSVTLPRTGPLTRGQVANMTPEEYAANKERLRAQLAAS